MRIGLIGAGRIGAFHAGTLAAHPDVGSLVVADADPVRARQVAAAHGGGTADVDALFASRPDAVVIASATAAHAGLLARAAALGVPAFCEKPLAVDLTGTVAALDAAAATGALVQVGFQRRFDPGYRAARAAVRAGRVGRLHTVRTVSSDAVPPPAAYVPLSGGLYRDCLIHDFDIIRWVTGREIVSVYAVGANVGADFFRAAGDVDTAAALLTLEDGVVATATATRYHAAGYDVRMELAGTADQLTVGMGPRAPLNPVGPPPTPRPAPWPGFLERFATAYRDELATFLRVVRGDEPNPCEPHEALRALLVAEACEVSRRENRPVRVAEVEGVARGCGGTGVRPGPGTGTRPGPGTGTRPGPGTGSGSGTGPGPASGRGSGTGAGLGAGTGAAPGTGAAAGGATAVQVSTAAGAGTGAIAAAGGTTAAQVSTAAGAGTGEGTGRAAGAVAGAGVSEVVA